MPYGIPYDKILDTIEEMGFMPTYEDLLYKLREKFDTYKSYVAGAIRKAENNGFIFIDDEEIVYIYRDTYERLYQHDPEYLFEDTEESS